MIMLEFVINRNVRARDKRRQCPVCGMPEEVTSRTAALKPLTPRAPCDDCRYLKRHLTEGHGSTDSTPPSECESNVTLTFPIASLIILDALSQVVGTGLNTGFSSYGCVGLAPAHIGRFIKKLRETGVIKTVVEPTDSTNARAPSFHCLVNEATFKHEIARFRHLLAKGKISDQHAIWEIWLDYAVAACIRFICDQSALHGLPTDPESGELCSVLRTAATTYSIAEVCSISLHAVQDAAELVEQGSTATDAAATIASNITHRSWPISNREPAPEPQAKSSGLPHSELGVWFHKWYGMNEHTRGTGVMGSIMSAAWR
jgi:hypothetical protein